LRLQTPEVPVEALAQRAALRAIGAGFRHHYEIPTGQRLLHAKGFPREAFQFISVNRSFRRSPRDRQAATRVSESVGTAEDREEAIA
jgi:hypothetical protein